MSAGDPPISDRLRERLQDWNWWYTEFYGVTDLDDPHDDLAEFSAIGLDLARKVKLELPDWTVVYSDRGAANRVRDLSRRFGVELPRCTWEYVVTLASDEEPVRRPDERIVVIGDRRFFRLDVVGAFIKSLAESGATIVTDSYPHPGVGSWATEEALNCGLNVVHLPGDPALDDQMIAFADRLVVFWTRASRRLLQSIQKAHDNFVPVRILNYLGQDVPLADILALAKEVETNAERTVNQWIRPQDWLHDEGKANENQRPSIIHLEEGEVHPDGTKVKESGWYLLPPADAANRCHPLGPFWTEDDARGQALWDYFDDLYPISL
jgi:hypothetical protein